MRDISNEAFPGSSTWWHSWGDVFTSGCAEWEIFYWTVRGCSNIPLSGYSFMACYSRSQNVLGQLFVFPRRSYDSGHPGGATCHPIQYTIIPPCCVLRWVCLHLKNKQTLFPTSQFLRCVSRAQLWCFRTIMMARILIAHLLSIQVTNLGNRPCKLHKKDVIGWLVKRRGNPVTEVIPWSTATVSSIYSYSDSLEASA